MLHESAPGEKSRCAWNNEPHCKRVHLLSSLIWESVRVSALPLRMSTMEK
jgi:hypothetical protein